MAASLDPLLPPRQRKGAKNFFWQISMHCSHSQSSQPPFLLLLLLLCMVKRRLRKRVPPFPFLFFPLAGFPVAPFLLLPPCFLPASKTGGSASRTFSRLIHQLPPFKISSNCLSPSHFFLHFFAVPVLGEREKREAQLAGTKGGKEGPEPCLSLFLCSICLQGETCLRASFSCRRLSLSFQHENAFYRHSNSSNRRKW